MLIRFALENYRSFCELQELSLVAESHEAHRASQCIPVADTAGLDLLRCGMLIGPNGCGKSNFINGLKLLRALVLEPSHEKSDQQGITPFSFERRCLTGPSRFEIGFLQEGVRYHYQVAMDRSRVHHEALFSYPEGRPRRLFERRFEPNQGRDDWYFSPSLKGSKRALIGNTRANGLFLALGGASSMAPLDQVCRWFRTQLLILEPGKAALPRVTLEMLQKAEMKPQILGLLRQLQPNFSGLVVRERDAQDAPSLASLPPSWLRCLGPEILLRYDYGGLRREIAFDEEAQGMQCLLILVGPLLYALNRGITLVVDEFDAHLHPLLLRHLLSLFQQPPAASAQLLFSNHKTQLLDLKLFRRDQIYLLDKSPSQSSVFARLSSFHPRRGESIERAYLAGRYGALPKLPSKNAVSGF